MSADDEMTVLHLENAEVRIFRDLEELSRAAARLVVELGSAAIASHGRFTLALSGGSTPKRLYSLLAEADFARQVPWNQVHIFWGDERCVPPDHPESNYRLARETLLSHVPVPAANVHRIRGEEPPQQAAQEYEGVLRDFFRIPPGGFPRFDFMLLGLGENGHTASLLPGSPALEERKRLVTTSFGGDPQVHRVTLTFPVLNASAVTLFLVAGDGKKETVAQILSSHPNRHLPAARVKPEDGVLLWFLDAAAAARLPKPQ